jgi:hypothetical protein
VANHGAVWREGIPFELENGMIWVKIAAGKKKFDFVVDSGAGSTVLSLETMRRLRLKRGEAHPVYGVGINGVAYRVENFEGSLGGVPLAGKVFAVNLRRPRGGKRRRIDGLIGQDFFRDRIVRIDFGVKRLFLLEKASVRPHAAVLPLRYQKDAMCVPVGVNGLKPEWTRLDTGCTSSLEWAAKHSPGQGQTRDPAGDEILADVQLGSERLRGVMVGIHSSPLFPGEAGLLGTGLLSRYCVTIDTRQMRVLLERL